MKRALLIYGVLIATYCTTFSQDIIYTIGGPASLVGSNIYSIDENQNITSIADLPDNEYALAIGATNDDRLVAINTLKEGAEQYKSTLFIYNLDDLDNPTSTPLGELDNYQIFDLSVHPTNNHIFIIAISPGLYGIDVLIEMDLSGTLLNTFGAFNRSSLLDILTGIAFDENGTLHTLSLARTLDDLSNDQARGLRNSLHEIDYSDPNNVVTTYEYTLTDYEDELLYGLGYNFNTKKFISGSPTQPEDASRRKVSSKRTPGDVISFDENLTSVILNDQNVFFADFVVLSAARPPVAPVPTMGQWGLICLGLLTFIFAIVGIRQQLLKTNITN